MVQRRLRAITAGVCQRNGNGRPWRTIMALIHTLMGLGLLVIALPIIMVRGIRMARLLLAHMGRFMAMGCVTWRAMSGSGQTLSTVEALAFSAAAVGSTSAASARSRAGATTTRTSCTSTTGFGCVVECFVSWIFRNPLPFVLLPFASERSEDRI